MSEFDLTAIISLVAIIATLLNLIAMLRRRRTNRLPLVIDEPIVEAGRLHAAREQARTIYQMASTLGATLDYEKVLNALLDIGVHGLRNVSSEGGLISAVMLFSNQGLRVAAARRFSRQDEKVILPGQRGILGLALRQTEPVFSEDAHDDPELQYISGLGSAKSVLALPLRLQFRSFGVLLFASQSPRAFSDDQIELLKTIGTQASIALQNALLYQEVRQEKERIVDVEEEARKKLARDLHDGPTQSVSAIAMRLNYIRTLFERRPAEVPDELYKLEELARRTTKEIRHMLFTLRPLVLETQGLTPAFKQLAEKIKETHGQSVIVEAENGIDDVIALQAQGVLFYIAEEAVNNARKYAQSEHIYIRLYRKGEHAVIEVQDNGLGFDVAAVNAGYDKRGSLGMINMRERAELAEGTLHLESTKGAGTRVQVFVPLQAPLEQDLPSVPTVPPRPRNSSGPLSASANRDNKDGKDNKPVLRSPAN